MVDPSPSPGEEDRERAEELRALARLLNDETRPVHVAPGHVAPGPVEPWGEAPVGADTEVLSPRGQEPAPPLDPESDVEADLPDVPVDQEPVPVEAQPSVVAQEGKGLIAQRFQVVGLLGGGPHGAVWRVRDHENQGREAALKILRQEWSHEPKLLIGLRAHLERSGSLTHESVNRLRDVGRTNDGRICSLNPTASPLTAMRTGSTARVQLSPPC